MRNWSIEGRVAEVHLLAGDRGNKRRRFKGGSQKKVTSHLRGLGVNGCGLLSLSDFRWKRNLDERKATEKAREVAERFEQLFGWRSTK